MKTLSRLTLFATTVTILIFICHALMTENLSKLEKERSYYRFSFPLGSNVERAIKEWKRYTYKRPVNIGLLIFPTPNVAHCYQAKFGSLEKSLLYKGRLPKKGECISNYNNNEKQKQVGALAISPKIIKYSIYPLTEIVDIYYTNTVYITGEPTQRAKAESFIAKYGDLKAEKETYTLHGANQYIGKVILVFLAMLGAGLVILEYILRVKLPGDFLCGILALMGTSVVIKSLKYPLMIKWRALGALAFLVLLVVVLLLEIFFFWEMRRKMTIVQDVKGRRQSRKILIMSQLIGILLSCAVLVMVGQFGKSLIELPSLCVWRTRR